MNKRKVYFIVTAAICLSAIFVIGMSSPSSPTVGEYNIWLDTNNDGIIDMKDIGAVARSFLATGNQATKSTLKYDSGWIDLSEVSEQNYVLTHNLNISEAEFVIDARQRLGGWNTTFGGADYDVLNAVVYTSEGYYVCAGESAGDAWLLKIDENGEVAWERTYGDYSYYDSASSLVQTEDGGYALVGVTYSFGSNGDLWLLKTDSDGTPLWNFTYGGNEFDAGASIVRTSDGGYALAGQTASFGDVDGDYWLVKTDVDGIEEWNTTIGGSMHEQANSVIQTTDGGYVLAGLTYEGYYGYSGRLVKIGLSGNVLWNRFFDGSCMHDVVQTDDGGYAVACEAFVGLGYDTDMRLMKTGSDGFGQWYKSYGGAEPNGAFSIVRTKDEGFALAGYTEPKDGGPWEVWLVEVDASGNIESSIVYDGLGSDVANSLVQGVLGEYVLAGYTDSYGAGSYDGWLIKTDSELGLSWIQMTPNSITISRGLAEPYANMIRVCIWEQKENP